MHSLNNMLGSAIFTSDSLNAICYQLSTDFINPHKHIFGGDYDVNVLLLALQQREFEYEWWDNRKAGFTVKEQCVGLLVNVRVGSIFSILQKIFRISDRHWLAVRRVGKQFYWMDSKEEEAKTMSENELEKVIGEMMGV